MSQSSMRIALFFLALSIVVAMSIGRAHAEDAPSSPRAEDLALAGICYARPINRVYVPINGGSFHVEVARGKVAFVQFPETMQLKNAIYEKRGFHVDQYHNTVTVSPDATLEDGVAANILLELGSVRLSMDVLVTESGRPATLVDVIPLPNDDFERRKNEEEARLAATRHERDALIMRRYRLGMARTLLGMREVRPQYASLGITPELHYAPEGEAGGALTRVFEADGYRYLEVTFENRTERNIPLKKAYISEGTGKAVPVDVMLQEPDKSLAELPFVARTRDTVRAMVVVPESIAAGLSGLRVHLEGQPGSLPIVATEVIELWPRMPEHIQRRRRWAKQISVSARVLGGGYWMGIGDDTIVLSGNEGTSMTGLGIRIGKGMHRNIVFEGEFVGARSGAANFTDVTWDGMTGDVTRHTSLARAQGMGVVRFGHRYVTSMRVGVGLQVADYDSSMTGAGTSVTGPGDGFEVDGLWSVGVGFDARLGEHWLLGAGLTFADTFNTDTRSLELGIHAGYRWSLAGEDGSLNY